MRERSFLLQASMRTWVASRTTCCGRISTDISWPQNSIRMDLQMLSMRQNMIQKQLK